MGIIRQQKYSLRTRIVCTIAVVACWAGLYFIFDQVAPEIQAFLALLLAIVTGLLIFIVFRFDRWKV